MITRGRTGDLGPPAYTAEMASSAPDEILELVDQFDRNLDDYHSPRFNEAQTRQQFIDPFFEALGWDIKNRQRWAEAYKEVIHEDSIRIAGKAKAPDYCFRVGGNRKFFVEAKKPSVDIKQDVNPAYQVRRYAWSAKLPLSILSDFEELSVYDCRIQPNKGDKASTARTMYFTYREYEDRWDEIASVFSKGAINRGSFDRYSETVRRKRGTAEVDEAFLRDLETWRQILARNIALRNNGLSVPDLNFAVQQIIDRIVFLRICEDRGIEPYGQLQQTLKADSVYGSLVRIFQRADDRYNSGLFHFKTEQGRSSDVDGVTLGLTIDNKTISDMIGNLYYPDSPYEFSVLSPDILGQVYEQFLGQVIRLTSGGRAKVEEKPEVKKAGGVYYTPTFIVDHIVEHSVGRLVDGKKPNVVSKLKILDPACGSGSFLIAVYQYLLDWHLEYYVEADPAKHARGRPPRVYQASSGDWNLTTNERKRILLGNIFGVDIDAQAVEVTKLSLLLKVLEGESHETLGEQLALFQERVLPDLGENIKCGNSLIGPEFYSRHQLALLDDTELHRVNVFDWATEFPRVFSSSDPGFDAVVGNPPYIRIQAMKQWAPLEVEFYKKWYESASSGNYDIYVVFVEKGLALLNSAGRLGYILPHKLLTLRCTTTATGRAGPAPSRNRLLWIPTGL